MPRRVLALDVAASFGLASFQRHCGARCDRVKPSKDLAPSLRNTY
ncbi:MAG: hypothetical protein ABI132_00400 [Rhodanobacteraceae bacterium]